MDFSELIRQRFSVLDYLHQPVAPELVRTIMGHVLESGANEAGILSGRSSGTGRPAGCRS